MNKKEAKSIIQEFGPMTGYFGNGEDISPLGLDYNVTQEDMREMLRYRMGFGQAETECIIAALVLAGGLKK